MLLFSFFIVAAVAALNVAVGVAGAVGVTSAALVGVQLALEEER